MWGDWLHSRRVGSGVSTAVSRRDRLGTDWRGEGNEHTTTGERMTRTIERTDLPGTFRNNLTPWLPGSAQRFLNDPITNAYLSRKSGPRVTRRIVGGK